MAELMKRFQEETGVDLFGGWAYEIVNGLMKPPFNESPWMKFNEWLAEQLTWRPVSEKPEKDDWVTLRRNVNGKTDDEQVWFYHLMDVKEWEGLVKTLGATHWLPIPPSY